MPAGTLITIIAIDLHWSLRTTILPEGVSDNKSARWDSTDIINRSSPFLTYSGSDSSEISFSIQLFATEAGRIQEDIVRPLQALKSLVYPVAPGLIPPSRCYINFGGIIGPTNFTGVCRSVSRQMPRDNAWAAGGIPMTATVQLSFVEYDTVNIPASLFGGVSGLNKPFGGL